MPSGTERMPRPAYVVDVDENGKQVRGTVRSALKEKPKVSQRDSRSGKTKKPHSDSGDKDPAYAQALEVVDGKETRLERRKSLSGSAKSPRKSARPPLTHENRKSTSGMLSVSQRSPSDIPSNYGIPPAASYGPPAMSSQPPMAIPLRPRAVTTQTYPNRPISYHQAYTSNGAPGPPLSMSAYYQPQPMIAPSYPPPSSNNSYMRYAATPNTQIDYFAQQMSQPPLRPLSARFDAIPRTQLIEPIARTTSAFGTRDTRRQSMDGQYQEGYYEDSYASRVSDPPVRIRESIRAPSVRPREDPDTAAMPPPPLPRPILRRPLTDYPAEPLDTRTEYSDRPERHERHERHERQIERRERPELRERLELREPSRPRRPSANRHSVSYDLGDYSEQVRIETANNGRRRTSYDGQSTALGSGAYSGYEDKIHEAANYQEEVAGPTVPLTADMLRKQQRRQGGSSRSTNSGSRDESDYKKSATTRTTRSGSGNDDENVTIKVTGQARVMVGGAQIDCNQGGEISISRQKTLRNGSERGSEYSTHVPQRQIDDRRSRIDRPIGRSRISSTHSYTRSTPQYQMDNYL